MYVSSRTPLHDFKLNDLVWGSRKLFGTRPKNPNKWTSVSIPCFKAKQCKTQSCWRPVEKVSVSKPCFKVIKQRKTQSCSRPEEKVLEAVREKSRRRREGLFSFSLRKEVIEEDFICVTGKMPERKIKVKKIYKDDKKQESIDYQKYLKEIVPGNWMSDIYCV